MPTPIPRTLAAGQRVDLVVEYFDNAGASTVRLEWKRPGSASYAVIPQSQLLAPATPIRPPGGPTLPQPSRPSAEGEWSVAAIPLDAGMDRHPSEASATSLTATSAATGGAILESTVDATMGSTSMSGSSAGRLSVSSSKAGGSRAGYRPASEASGSLQPDWMTLADAVWGEEGRLAVKPAFTLAFRRRP